jgi:hypothetical protein
MIETRMDIDWMLFMTSLEEHRASKILSRIDQTNPFEKGAYDEIIASINPDHGIEAPGFDVPKPQYAETGILSM